MQLSTKKEADFVVSALGNIGKGVKEIYIPEYQGPFSVPEDGDKKFYHLRFNNGVEGVNVGLVLMFMKYSPTTWPAMVAADVNRKPFDWMGFD